MEADRKLLAQLHWKLAVAVYGSSDAAHEAGCEPYEADHDANDADLMVYCAYVSEVKKCLKDPEVETPGSLSNCRIESLVEACRAWAPLHLKQPQVMQEVATANLDSLAELDNLALHLAERNANSSSSQDGQDAIAEGQHSSDDDTCLHLGMAERLRRGGIGEFESMGPDYSRGDAQTKSTASADDSHAGSDVESDQELGIVPQAADAAAVLKAINMTSRQEDALLKELQLVNADLAAISAERKAKLAALREGKSWASERLMGLELDEGSRKADFLIWFTHDILSALGHAKVDAASFPFPPDPIGLGNELYKQKALATGGVED